MPVEAKELTFTYNAGSPFETAALDHVNFTIKDGEFIGIIGHTGSGKSTLIQHLNGLIKPTSGTVIVDGLDLSDKETSLKEVRRRIGLVFQYPEYQLFEETVRQDVAFGPKNLGLPQDEISALCDIAMDGDRGIIEGLGCLKFDLPKTIANGDDVCQIRITRK